MQKTLINRLAFALAAFAVAGTTTSKAATYNIGDLLIGFVATGGTGADTTLIANLGVTTTYRDQTTDSINFINIGTQLANTFNTPGGAAWYDRTDLYVSLLGVRSSSNTSSSIVNGDPARTLYASQPRTAVGTEGTSNSSIPTITGDGAYTSVAVAMLAVSNRFKTSATDSALTMPDSLANTIDEFTGGNVSYGAYQSRVDQAFTATTWGTIGLAGTVEAALDLYRNQARNDIAGQTGFGEPVGPGTFEGTFTINQSGQVSFLAAVPEPGSALMLGLAGIGSLLRRRRA
jgi:hypothetical protein